MKIFNVFEIEMACRIVGTGPPILLVHGFPLDHSMWQHQVSYLAERYQVIAPDLRGFGLSQRGTAELTMSQFAEDLAELLRQVVGEQPICFCGLSMGGYIAWEFHRSFPGRISQLILCNTRSAADDETAVRVRRMAARSVLKYGMDELARSQPARLLATNHTESQTALSHQLSELIRRAAPPSVADGLLGMSMRRDATPWLSSVACPTLLMVGEQDRVTPPDEMKRVADAIAGSQFLVVPAAGHLAPLENPGVVNRAIGQFLADNSD